jgi:hypothetical protein
MTRRKATRMLAVAVCAGSICSVLGAASAAGYTFIYNNYPGQPVGCTNRMSPPPELKYYWCVRWPLSATGYSSTVYVYLDSTLLTNHPIGETTDLKKEARDAFARWNAVPARSPFFKEVDSLGASSHWTASGRTTYSSIARTGYVEYPTLAETEPFTPCMLTDPPERNAQGGCRTADTHREVAFTMDFASWANFQNHYLTPMSGKVDGTWVMMHELGHVLGLGHTGMRSLMQLTWPNNVYMDITPTTNSGGDVPGLQVFYSPSFCMTCTY